MVSRRRFLAGMPAAYLGVREAVGLPAAGFLAAPAAAAGATRIGNFYYLAPNGIAFIKDDAAGFVMNPGGVHTAGTVAPDDSFHKVIFTPKVAKPSGRRVEFRWSRRGDAMVGRIDSVEAGEMSFDVSENWPGFRSEFSADGGGVQAMSATGVRWSLRASPEVKSADAKQFTLALGGPGKPTYLVAGFGELTSLDGIDAVLDAAERAYRARRPKAVGPSGDILAAIADNLNNSRMYASDNKMVAISVSRTFGTDGPNFCPYFCWDSFFSGLLACLDDPAMGRQTVRAILSGQTEEGLVPNYMHWNNGGISKDRSQPPVGSMCIWKMHQHWPDAEFLREVYPKLATWHGWWLKARNGRGDGMLQWGSSTGVLQDAQYETGWDDTPHFEGVNGVKMVGHTMNVDAVDLCSLWAMDAHYLALIAEAIGKTDDARRYRKDETEMNARMNARLWNERLGIYCSRFWDKADGTAGEFLTRLTPANFYPMISGAPDARRAQRVLAVMTDPEQFWGEWILPTVSRKDPLFLQQTYWHGTIWGPVNYLVWQGVKRYATAEVEAAYAQKSVHLFMNNWQANGYCGENFLSLDGSVGGNRYYTWGALLCLIGVESVVDVGDDGMVRAGAGYNEAVELTNLPIGGRMRRASVRYGKAEVGVAV